jgi:hypothetical protein
MALVYKSKLEQIYNDALFIAFEQGLKQAEAQDDDSIIKLFQNLEDTMKCCGIHNKSDYRDHPNIKLSDVCLSNSNVAGCAEKIIGFLKKNLPIIGGTLGGILTLELITLISSIVLAVVLKNAPNRSYSSNPGRVLQSMGDRYR